MKLAVVGDRHYGDFRFFSKVLRDELERYPADEIVTGDATGTDTMALDYALAYDINITVYCASRQTFRRLSNTLPLGGVVRLKLVSDWDEDGRAAGHIRNGYILRHPVQRVLQFDGGGPGSRNMQQQAKDAGIEVERWVIDHGTKNALPEELTRGSNSLLSG